MRYDVCVIGLGRIGLPLALSFADAGLSRARRRQGPRAAGGDRRAADAVQGAGHRRADRARRASVSPAAPPTPRRPTRSCSRSARRRCRTSRSTSATSAPCSTTCCRTCARTSCWCCARRSRPGTTEFVAGYLEKQRGFRVGEDIFVAHVPERIAADRFMEEIGTLPCIVGGVGEALRRARGAAVRAARRADRADHAGAGRAGEDLDQHPALRDVRAAEPADDGLRAPRRERLRRHRADQPRLSARRDGPARADRRHVPAQGLRVLRGALERARACCWPSRACTRPCRCSSSTASSAGSAGGCASASVAVLGLAFKADTDDERDSLSHKLIRLLERELADVVGARPGGRDADGLLRGGRDAAPTSSSSPPTTARTRRPRRCARSPSSPARTA